MAKKSKKERDLQLRQSRRLIDLITGETKMREYWEARFGSGFCPKKGAFDAVDLRVCKHNVSFLEQVIDDLQETALAIEAMPKQGDMVDDMEAKEAQLRGELLGESEADEDEELGPRPPARSTA